MSTTETADALGISEETVKIRLQRARSILRKKLYSHASIESREAFAFGAARLKSRLLQLTTDALKIVQEKIFKLDRDFEETKSVDKGNLKKLFERTGVKIQEVKGKLLVDEGSIMDFLGGLDRRLYEVELVKGSPESFRAASRSRIGNTSGRNILQPLGAHSALYVNGLDTTCLPVILPCGDRPKAALLLKSGY